jgi:hypothetical protein
MLADHELGSANASRRHYGAHATANMILTGPQTASIGLGAPLIYRILLLVIFTGMCASDLVLLFRPAVTTKKPQVATVSALQVG